MGDLLSRLTGDLGLWVSCGGFTHGKTSLGGAVWICGAGSWDVDGCGWCDLDSEVFSSFTNFGRFSGVRWMSFSNIIWHDPQEWSCFGSGLGVVTYAYDLVGNWFLDWMSLRASGKDMLLVYFIVFIYYSFFQTKQSLESAWWLPWQFAHLMGLSQESSMWSEPLSALFTNRWFQAFRFMVAEFLTVIASKWVWYIWADFDKIVANFKFFWKWGFVEGEDISICIDGFFISFDGYSFNVCNTLICEMRF